MLSLGNDLDSVGDVRAEYRCHGKASLTGRGLSALLVAKLRVQPSVSDRLEIDRDWAGAHQRLVAEALAGSVPARTRMRSCEF
jgi:hypothetical protein